MSQLSTLEILRWGRALHESGEHYVSGPAMADADGNRTVLAKTCRWCAFGFLRAIVWDLGVSRDAADAAEHVLEKVAVCPTYIHDSDAGHESAIAMWDRAIKLAETEAADGK
ncbi:MAG TPA: hypothetical protein VHO25_22075 [Polyangiaceae bacterium]|nr:hypothetical protein [Polyangiaceae bacterium]